MLAVIAVETTDLSRTHSTHMRSHVSTGWSPEQPREPSAGMQSKSLLADFRSNRVLADQGSNANKLRCFIVDQGGQSAIPETCNRRFPFVHDRERNIVERTIGWPSSATVPRALRRPRPAT